MPPPTDTRQTAAPMQGQEGQGREPSGGGRPIEPGLHLIATPIGSARDITLRHTRIAWGDNRPDYFQHALYAEKTENLVLDDFRGDAAHPNIEPQVIN